MCSANPHPAAPLGLRRSLTPAYPPSTIPPIHRLGLFLGEPRRRRGAISGRRCDLWPVAAMDEDTLDDFSLSFEPSDGNASYEMYSEGEDSDTELVVNPIGDVDLPLRTEHSDTPEAALTVTAHRFATIQMGHRKKRTQPGIMISIGLIAFLVLFLLFFDWCSWKIVRLPLEPFYLTHPFAISAVLSACVGCLFVPIVDGMMIQQILRKKGHIIHSSKRRIPTMGGLFFVPIGIAVARAIAGLSSIQVNGAVAVTSAFAAIGFLNDILNFIHIYQSGLPGWFNLVLQVSVGTWFSFWLHGNNVPTPYNMKFLVPLPQPHGLVYLGKFYLVLTTLSLVAMGNILNLTEGLDGLVGGVSAVAFIAMSAAVLPICPELAVFGASMAGACIGFLSHNRYRASIFMGNIGTLALGGALAAMAAFTGMFFPLFISSGVFILEVFTVIVQVLFMMATCGMRRTVRFVSPVKPSHHYLNLCGIKAPFIIASAYALSCVLALVAGYVGLISA